MTRSGSAAANGIAPSLMNAAPSSHAALPFSRSTGGNRLRASTVEASAMASGGTMPAHMTAAMMRYGVGFSARARGKARDREGVGDLVDRARRGRSTS